MTWTKTGPFFTQIAFSLRNSDVLYNLSTSSIQSITNLTNPSVETIAPTDLFSGLEIFFGGDISTTTELNPDSVNVALLELLAQGFVGAATLPKQYGPLASETLPSGEAYPMFWAILTLPLLLFQTNFFAPNVAATQPEPNYPSELYVSVEILDATVRAVIPQWTFILYLIASSTVYFWCVGGMYFALYVQGPPFTPFEIIDFASRIVSNHGNNSISKFLDETWDGNTNSICRKLQDKNMFLRNVRFPENGEEILNGGTSAKIGFTDDKELCRLNKGQDLQ